MREDEELNIADGLLSNSETAYIAYFNSPKQAVPTIVAAVQYSSSDDGAFISWLCMSEDLAGEDGVTGTDSVQVLRHLGLGMFLQNLIQFQQVSRGRSPCLLLQAIVKGDVSLYYMNRGYMKAPLNDL